MRVTDEFLGGGSRRLGSDLAYERLAQTVKARAVGSDHDHGVASADPAWFPPVND
jgi:hypothetical protein